MWTGPTDLGGKSVWLRHSWAHSTEIWQWTGIAMTATYKLPAPNNALQCSVWRNSKQTSLNVFNGKLFEKNRISICNARRFHWRTLFDWNYRFVSHLYRKQTLANWLPLNEAIHVCSVDWVAPYVSLVRATMRPKLREPTAMWSRLRATFWCALEGETPVVAAWHITRDLRQSGSLPQYEKEVDGTRAPRRIHIGRYKMMYMF